MQARLWVGWFTHHTLNRLWVGGLKITQVTGRWGPPHSPIIMQARLWVGWFAHHTLNRLWVGGLKITQVVGGGLPTAL